METRAISECDRPLGWPFPIASGVRKNRRRASEVLSTQLELQFTLACETLAEREERRRPALSFDDQSSSEMAKTFESLVSDIVKTRVPHRLLCVFLETNAKPCGPQSSLTSFESAKNVPCPLHVCADAHMAVTPGLTFDLLVKSAERDVSGWSTVVVAACHNSDRTMPTEETADLYLANMRHRILAGDRTSLVEFDRHGNSVVQKIKESALEA